MEKISVAQARQVGGGRPAGAPARLGAHAPRFQGRLQLPRTQRRLLLRQRPGRRRRHAAQLRERDQASARRLQRHRRGRGPAPRRPRARRPRSRPTSVTVHGWADAGNVSAAEEGPLDRVPARASPTCGRARNTFGAVARVRNCVCRSIHEFFQEQGFLYVHPPIITASDCEGAGQMFRVTTLDLGKPPRNDKGEIDFTKDFFGQADLPDRQRPARGGDLRLRAGQGLHLRPDLPRRELQHLAPPGRVLDGRAGDGLLRPERQHGPGRGVPQAHLHATCSNAAPRT